MFQSGPESEQWQAILHQLEERFGLGQMLSDYVNVPLRYRGFGVVMYTVANAECTLTLGQ